MAPPPQEAAAASDLRALISAAFQHAPQYVWLLSAGGSVLHANGAALALGEQRPGAPIWEHPCWADGESASQLREQVLDAGEARRFPLSLVDAQGRLRVVDITLRALESAEAGRFLRLDATDVTHRAEVERALRASEAKFGGILSIAAEAIISTDEGGRIVHFNQGAAQIFGWDEEEIIGRNVDVLIPGRYRATHPAHMAAFGRGPHMARRMGERREIFGLRRDGAEFPAEASISKLTMPDGRLLFTVVLRDITERKRAERSAEFIATAARVLASSLDYEATLAQVANLPVPSLADGCIVDVVDPRTGQLRSVHGTTGDESAEALFSTLASRHAPTLDSASRVVDVLRTGAAELVREVDEAFIERHADDHAHAQAKRDLGIRSVMYAPLQVREEVFGVMSFYALAASGRRFDEADLALAREVAARCAVALDNAHLYDSAQRASRARDEVLGVVSHDLRNPLSAIAMCARVMLENPPADERARRELLGAIYQSTGLANRMIQDLLDVANIEAGKLSVEQRPELVEDLLAHATPMFESMTSERGLRLRIETPGSLPPVAADEGRILQVLGNLVGNAAKFTETGGEVVVRAEPQGDHVLVSVSDSGSGIPADQHELIFQRYWHDRRSSRRRGSGLGLAISRGIIEAHGGRIWVESDVGRGSTFYFTLPVSAESA